MAKLRLRTLWLQLHKWIGITLAILIVPVSLTGSALVWHDWLDAQVNPERHSAMGPAALPPSAYERAAAQALQPGERIASIAFPRGGEGAVQVTVVKQAGQGRRPARAWIFLDPRDARLIERAGSGEGLVRVLHVLHGSLMVPGVGRQIVGWIGVAMLISSLSGIWLWWPSIGGFRRGLRWRRQERTSANLHHSAGFWVSLPLAMLSFTGVWISFPAFFGTPSQGGAPPFPVAASRLGPDAALAAAHASSPGAPASIAWPTDRSPEWTVRLAGAGEVKVANASGAATPVPPRPETIARTMRRWHDGDGMGPLFQAIIFVGGILPALLAVTGIMMWLRGRSRRAEAARRASARAAPAE